MSEAILYKNSLPNRENMPALRRQAHNALHWMARLTASYTPQDIHDPGRVVFSWQADQAAIQSPVLHDQISIVCRLAKLELQFCENGQPVPHCFSFQERTPAHVEAWILVELLHRGVERRRFSKKIPYVADDIMLGDNEEHEVEMFATDLAALQAWFASAGPISTAVHDALRQKTGPGPQPCVWPEVFQIGVEIPAANGARPAGLRVGLSAGDKQQPEPFFFATKAAPTAKNGHISPEQILPISQIVAQKMTADDVAEMLCKTAGRLQ